MEVLYIYRFGCTSKIGLEKGFLEDEKLHFFRTLEASNELPVASNELPVNAGQLIFIQCIICIWPYPMVSKHKTLLHSYRSEGRSKSVWRQLRINMLW